MPSEKIDFLSVLIVLLFMVFLFLLLPPGTRLVEKIDVHEHIKDMKQVERLLPIMNKLRITKMILLGTPTMTFGENTSVFNGTDAHMEELFKIKKKYPSRFLIFYAPNPNDPLAPQKVRTNAPRGIDGLKFYHGVIGGLGSIDGSRMYEIYKEADRYDLPVVIHVEALNATQFSEFSHALEDFPNVKFVCPHFCGVQNKYDALASLFDKHRNLYTDMSPWHRVGKPAVNNIQAARNFVIKYQDRIMFSTDIVLTDGWISSSDIERWFRCDIDLLEASVFKCYKEGNKLLSGLNLPETVLIKIYKQNPRKLLN